ncbi:MAG: cytochrome-c oxidase, cbb3-type subunit II [Gammaproteobacteria bacterium]|nr:MAG: cytochrome-c oxidase, cbb3-type subunit II [Gammaproteobacteria bacterium]
MNHDIVEKNVGVLIILTLVAMSFGGLAQIVPLFFIESTTTPIKGLMPLPALVLEGRDIYIREGCHVCHTQMIRPFRSETERYGHYSVAGEQLYEHPFLWGSKRTGPDLARVGARYSDEWHRAHLYNPRDVVPISNMPSFPWLFQDVVTGKDTAAKMRALRIVGVPYTDEDIENAASVFASGDVKEVDALVAYLQQLGTLIKQKR